MHVFLNVFAFMSLFCPLLFFFLAPGYFRAFSSKQGIEPLGNKILKALPCLSMPLINKHDIFQIFHNSFFLNLCDHVIS